MNENEQGKELQPRQVAAITALLTCKDVPTAALESKVPVGTLRRWLTSDEAFRAELRAAEQIAIGNATRLLSGLAEQAVQVIKGIMEDASLAASVRLRAALGALDQMGRLRELTELEERISALEALSAKE